METITCPWDPDPATWVRGLTLRDTQLLGAALCMRQVFALNGNEFAPLRSDLSVVHSEPAAIMLFLNMVNSLVEEEPYMEYLLTVRSGCDVEYAVRYWADLLGEPAAMFDWQVERSRSREPRLTDTYLRVTIPDSGDLYQQVDSLYCTYLEALDFEVDNAAAAR